MSEPTFRDTAYAFCQLRLSDRLAILDRLGVRDEYDWAKRDVDATVAVIAVIRERGMQDRLRKEIDTHATGVATG